MKNNYRVENDVVYIEVNSKGKKYEVLIDLDDIGLLEGKTLGFVANNYSGYRKGGKTNYLHRLIVKAKKDKIVDHINGNKLDNRKENLRETTHLVNNRNINNKYKNELPRNVTWSKQRECYVVRLTVNNKTLYCGSPKDINEADKIAQQARSKYW